MNILMDFTGEMIPRLKPFEPMLHGPNWHPAVLEKIERRDVKGTHCLFREHLEEYLSLLKELEPIPEGRDSSGWFRFPKRRSPMP